MSLVSRRDLTNRFAAVAAVLTRLKAKIAVIDAIVRWLEPSQSAWFRGGGEQRGDAGIRLLAMDLLWDDGGDVRSLPIDTRLNRLHQIGDGSGMLFPVPFEQVTPGTLTDARRIGADGVLAKRRNSRYRPFGRHGDWTLITLARTDARRAAESHQRTERKMIELALRRERKTAPDREQPSAV